MDKYLNPIAEIGAPDSGEILTPGEAYEIREDHQFFCPDHDCLDPKRILIPSKSILDNYFFKHRGECSHHIHPQTLLHKLAVKWFEGKDSFEIPEQALSYKVIPAQVLKLDTLLTRLEYRKLETAIPDVRMVTTAGFEFAVEIVVTSDLSKDKIEKLVDQFDLPTVRIGLADFYEQYPEQCRTDYGFVHGHLDGLLGDRERKSWVVPLKGSDAATLEITDKPKSDDSGCLVALGLGIAGLWYLLSGKKKKKYKRKA